MTNKLDSRTEDEKQADEEHATMVAMETNYYRNRRRELEHDMTTETDERVIRYLRRAIAETDRALMELAANRLPRIW